MYMYNVTHTAQLSTLTTLVEGKSEPTLKDWSVFHSSSSVTRTNCISAYLDSEDRDGQYNIDRN